MLMALTGLNSRGYKNSTLLFNLARIFIAHSPARALINPPWTGIAEPMWEPMQIRHRSAYYDAFFTEALLSFVETGLASADEAAASRRAIADMVDFCLTTQREEVPSHDGSTVRVDHRAGAAAASAVLAASSPRSSRISASASTCRTATPRPARSRRRRRPARPIRSSTSRCSISTPATRCATAPTSRGSRCRSTTTSITRAASSPGSTISRASGPSATISIRRSISTFSKSVFPQSRALEDPRDAAAAGDGASHHRLPAAAGRKRRVQPIRARTSIICRNSTRAYFGRCYAAFIALPPAAQRAIDPDGTFEFIRGQVLAYVQTN